MKNEDLLMSQLLEETCSESTKLNELSENDSFNLVKYFEKRLNQVDFLSVENYIKEEGIVNFELIYMNQTKCYRLNSGNSILDFPSNWSVFKSLMNKELRFVTQAEDQDFLCEIFSELNANCESFLVFNENEKCYLLMFRDFSGKTHYEWIKEYFENKLKKYNQVSAA